ncbi:uncharacterized protein [Nothobranchius furzeri]|uniref:LOC107377060-like protein n=1 Tax=Nothobranchius furzeri TaxID=105023 RepID=A0A9D2YWW0_NOTFU|nr:putative LOC107377060-like protein [Nothobranchius furzeri]
MVTVKLFLRFALCALLILDVCGFPSKGLKSHSQSSSHPGEGDDFTHHRGSATGRYAPLYSTSSQEGFPDGAFVPVQAAYPVGTIPAGYEAGGPGSSLPETKWTVAPNIFSEEGLANTQTLDSSMLLPQNPAPSGPFLQSGETSNVEKEAELGNYQHETEEFGYPGASMGPGPVLQSGETSNIMKEAELGNYQHETEEFGYPGASMGPGPVLQSGETSNVMKEAELGNYQHETEEFGYPGASMGPGPVLQSGETSNVMKEAELGNYQHETEEFGYPGASIGPGQGLPSYPMPYVGGGVFWGSPYLYPLSSPYPYFDYRLLYGMYPTGTYTTFSKSNEKGKDYYQSIHYLKEHAPETLPPGQQKKIFP